MVELRDQCTYNMLTADKVGVIIPEDSYDVSISKRDIIAKELTGNQ